MNKQRKVVITTTYNEMGIIIDTKAEEAAQPDLQPTCNQLATDCISRQAAIDKFIDELDEIFADLRERHVDDSVCGLCEYDGAYLGQSGDWCNECPGFEKDDCFKLSGKIRKEWTDEIIKALPSAQSEQSVAQERYEDLCEYFGNDHDAIKTVLGDRKEFKAWLERLKWHVKECNKLSRQLEAQPEIIHCKDCVHHIDGFFCRQANHHTSDSDHCASVFRAERR